MSATDLQEPLLTQLGTPAHAGSFRLADCGLVRKNDKTYERLYPLPSDLILQKLTKNDDSLTLYALQPQNLASDFLGSYQGQLAILKAPTGKPESGYWLNEAGFRAYLKGEKPNLIQLIRASDLWQSEWRLGIALDSQSRTASEGQLYTTEAIALQKDIFLTVSIVGANDFPKKGTLRLGGDGRAAGFETAALPLLPTIPDNELLNHYYKDGDSKWLGILLQRYTMLLFGVCMKYLKNEEEAKDAVQQVFEKSIKLIIQL